jgi:hypothetical protein
MLRRLFGATTRQRHRCCGVPRRERSGAPTGENIPNAGLLLLKRLVWFGAMVIRKRELAQVEGLTARRTLCHPNARGGVRERQGCRQVDGQSIANCRLGHGALAKALRLSRGDDQAPGAKSQQGPRLEMVNPLNRVVQSEWLEAARSGRIAARVINVTIGAGPPLCRNLPVTRVGPLDGDLVFRGPPS